MQHVGVLRQHGFRLGDAALRGRQLSCSLFAGRAGLRQTRLLLVQRGGRGIVGCLLGVEILLGQELALKSSLARS